MRATRRAAHRRAWPVAVALVIGACGRGGDASETSVVRTHAPSTTNPRPATTTTTITTSSSVAVSTTGASTSTATTTAATTTCTERSPTRPLTVDATIEAELATFRPLAATPTITLDVQPPELPQRDDATVSVQRIPGGLLVLSRVGSFAVEPMPATPTTVTALDWDGTVRWVRCLTERYPSVVVAPADAGPDAVLVSGASFEGPEMRSTWSALALADGRDLPAVAARFGVLEGGGAGLRAGPPVGRWLLLEPQTVDGIGPYGLVDLGALTVWAVAPPPVDGRRSTYVAVDENGTVVAYGVSPDGPVLAWWRDGRWTTGAAGAGLGPRVGFVGDAPDGRGALRGLAADGAVRWTVPGRVSPAMQGTGVVFDGDTAIAQTCEPVGEFECTYRLTAVGAGSGDVRWELTGLRLIAGSPADGHVMVSEGDLGGGAVSWLLVDTATGTPIPGQRWTDGTAFSHPCCGESEYNSTERHGAVMIVVEGRSVRVWLPADVAMAGWTRRLP